MTDTNVKQEVAVTEMAKAAAEVVGVAGVGAVAAGGIDYKKVALIAGGTLAVIGAAYLTKRIIDRRKAAMAKAVEDAEVETCTDCPSK